MKIRNRKTVIAAVAALLLMGVSVPILAVSKRKR